MSGEETDLFDDIALLHENIEVILEGGSLEMLELDMSGLEWLGKVWRLL